MIASETQYAFSASEVTMTCID